MKLKKHSLDAQPTGPLHGVRVVDMTRFVTGNMMGHQLADYGAEVIKIEPPEGDPFRIWTTAGKDVWWQVYSRNKKSVSLNFRSKRSIEVIKKLILSADVLVENFKAGTLEKMGLDPQELLKEHPKLVITRISGWGQTGAFKHKPGFGTLVEGYSGFAAINGFEDRPPVLPPMFLGDMTAGIYGAFATVAALLNVKNGNGKGQVIDLALFDPILATLGPQAANYFLTGQLKRRTGSLSSTTCPRNVYKTSDDRWLAMSAAKQSIVEKLFTLMGREDMIHDPRFADNAARLAHVEIVDGAVADFVRQRSLKENLALFEEHGITAGPVNDASMLLDDDYVASRDSLILFGEEGEEFPMHNVSARMSETPGNIYKRAPKIGENNDEVLSELLGAEVYESYKADETIV
ncbi:CaiB/BaiF CoA-transferase family protein [Bordetella sp. 15P40C-2]|uniref:CaiB/BaiF CoA transferase family protein n=1 Tax=Bordetella sp. 15P40C-2 TaxID=2572246 RepID=UPI00132882AA|nr:CoA transferase [Bordetella sp. 15P40C-2]MVW72845.1 CoA transferase [Bordetella sp. 15P40C-2]